MEDIIDVTAAPKLERLKYRLLRCEALVREGVAASQTGVGPRLSAQRKKQYKDAFRVMTEIMTEIQLYADQAYPNGGTILVDGVMEDAPGDPVTLLVSFLDAEIDRLRA